MKESKGKRLLRFIWKGLPYWLVIAAMFLFILWLGDKNKDKKDRLEEEKKAAMATAVPSVSVITLTLQHRRLVDQITLPAEVEPFENLWVQAEVPGLVTKVLVEEGQMIKKGKALFKLDDRDYRSRLARIQANYKMAKLDYDRNVTLAKRKITAASRLDESEARLNDIIAQRREAELALSRTNITAPIGGRLNEVPTKEGDLLKKGDNVAQILQFEQVKVTVGVPESDVAACFNLTEADVVIEALDGLKVKGKKIFLSRTPRSLARLYDLDLLVDNPDGSILPGMFARVELIKEIFKEGLSIPLYAVITRADERYVYVEKDGKAEKRPVELGILIGWEVQVKAGLKPGEKVVVVGQRFLDEGQAVEVIKNVNHPDEILDL